MRTLWDHPSSTSILGLLPGNFTDEEQCFICGVYSEAGVLGKGCQRAVASVILNRQGLTRRRGCATSICEIVSAKTPGGGQRFDGVTTENYKACRKCEDQAVWVYTAESRESGRFAWGSLESDDPGTYFANDTEALRRNAGQEVSWSLWTCRSVLK